MIPTSNRCETAGLLPSAARVCLALLVVLTLPGLAGAQAIEEATEEQARLHGVFGLFGGRLDLHRGPELDVLGGRLGLGFGELVHVTGFYWHEVDTSDRAFRDASGWGAEAQLDLNAGFGITPFITAGLARVSADPLGTENAPVFGAGLLIPLGSLAVQVAARDYVFGVSGIGDDTGDEGATHNWLFSAGLTATLGPRSTTRRVAVPVPVSDPDRGPERTQAVAPQGDAAVTGPSAVPAAGEDAAVRNYQSERRIEVPLPLEGSITIRYGPEGSAADGSAAGTPAAGTPANAASSGGTGEQGSARTPSPVSPPAGDEAVDRIVERTVASLLARLDAIDARRQDALRADLDRALAAHRSQIREIVRAEMAALAPDLAAPALRDEGGAVRESRRGVQTGAPATGVRDSLTAAIVATAARLEAVRAETARLQAADAGAAPSDGPVGAGPAVARDDGPLRGLIAEIAGRYGELVGTAETPRGPGLVVAGGAFAAGSALADEGVRRALEDLSALLEEFPDATIFVQGHTDAVGEEVANQRLSELRAETVRALLVRAGVAPGRIHALGFGAGRPVASNATPAGRAMNRRVEIVVARGDPIQYGGGSQ